MRDILDPKDTWLGTPIGAQIFGNKRPVALDDGLTILKDSGPISVDVLSNDYDPEGGLLTLVSASAALGTAVVAPDQTVTYTPPSGISGADTVVYEIADDQDQRRTAQINVTIDEPELTITTLSDNTLVVNAETGVIDITLSAPAEYAGSYQVNTADLAGGPINLVAPTLTGTVATGQVLNATDGLWIYDSSAGTVVRNWQWRRAGSDIPGETGATYTVQNGDAGPGISVLETLSDGFGQRSAESAVSGASFIPSNDTALISWWDASDTATVTETNGAVSAWADKAGGAALAQATASRQPATGTRSLNGLNVLDFSQENSLERTIALPTSGDVAVHMVLEIDAVSGEYEAVLALNATNDMQIDAGSDTQFNGRVNAAGIGPTAGLSGGPFSGALILSVVFDQTTSSELRVFVENIQRGASAYTTPLDPSQMLRVMTNRSRNAWIDGSVAELIVTGDVTNRADHHAYLATKWGLA